MKSMSTAGTLVVPVPVYVQACHVSVAPVVNSPAANEQAIHRHLMNNFTDDVHRPALPYKFKFKVSGCPNDCQNAIERSDFAIIGTWRDDMKVDQEEVKNYLVEERPSVRHR